MELNRNLSELEADLRQVCAGIACFVLHNSDHAELIDPASIWTNEDRAKMTESLYAPAKNWVRLYSDLGHNPDIVVQAVRFLGNQATPFPRDDVSWFVWGLDALLMQFNPRLECDENLRFFETVKRAMDARLIK